jgi:hypothetical protein
MIFYLPLKVNNILALYNIFEDNEMNYKSYVALIIVFSILKNFSGMNHQCQTS